ncbi:PIR Superfamily Protein [Plasmodium ovale curtisi]|uniref:PIR Superfamily Protein n=1 Tax=Plasmodium ovale curtisi TaxID=864141 RepID=A0A1A8WL88_PLAOA|nr:PIR Superfamily Protein [Plasmodium ovale curtisi]
MTLNKGKGKEIYKFCINSHYYEVLLKDLNDNKSKVEEEDKCDNLSSSMSFSTNLPAKNICQEFKFLYKLFSKYSVGRTHKKDIYSDYDCDFLNYWLNGKLRESINGGSINVNEFYAEIKKQDENLFSDHAKLGSYMNVINPDILKNMKILYELYHTKQKILEIMLKQDDSINEKNLCPDYLEKCYDKYIEGMHNCRNGSDDFCKALKSFEGGYKYLIEEKTDESGHCKVSEYFLLPDYDSVLEKKRRIMTIKILSSPLILSFVIPLLYKYTPLGPLLRTKINVVKNRWMNPDKNREELLLSSTDIEDNISDNGNYNIGYYSGTN